MKAIEKLRKYAMDCYNSLGIGTEIIEEKW